MKKTLFIILLSMLATQMIAQPAKRRTTPTKNSEAQQKSQTASDRFSIMFPTSDAMPEDVAWKRDLYRELDLTKQKNSPLYYPVMPVDKQCNLFTYLFRLMLTGRVTAYDYKMTGIESFNAKDKIDIEDFLKRYSIYHEEKNGKFEVADADVPSELVKRFYIKESSYLDQRTGTIHTKVQALCPIMLEGGEFGEDIASPKPMFWMKYEDVAPYLAKLPVMASDLNNVTHMTADDYFTLNRYEGKIYKTNNMQGKVIAEYCKEDSTQRQESKRIDKELTDFENHLWGHKEKTDSVNHVEKESSKTATAPKQKKEKTENVTTEPDSTEQKPSRTRRTNSKAKKPETDTGAAPRSSARRQRR